MSANIALIQSDKILSDYVREVSKYPLLSVEEEYMLAKRVADYQDVEAAHSLVTTHLRLVVKVAMQMRGYGIALMDLISEGNIGLMHAVKKFNPELGYRLSTYAMWWIKANIQEFIMKSWSLVKIGTTIAQKKLFFSLNKAKKAIQALDGRNGDYALSEQNIKSIANDLHVTEREVVDMDNRLSMNDVSLDNVIRYEDNDKEITLLDTISDNGETHEIEIANNQETDQRRKLFNLAIDKLNDREKDIVLSRHALESAVTLDDLSKKYGVSRERIRQIESRAFEKLKQYCVNG